MIFYGKIYFKIFMLTIFLLQFLASTQKELSTLDKSDAAWISKSPITENPQDNVNSLSQQSGSPPQFSNTSTHLSYGLKTRTENSRMFSSNGTSTRFSSLQYLPNLFPPASNVKLSQKTKRSTIQEDFTSPIYEFISKLSLSTQILINKNTSTANPLQEISNLQQSDLKHSTTQSYLLQSQTPLNYQRQTFLTSDASETFGDPAQPTYPRNDSNLINASQEQEILNWFENGTPGWMKPPESNNPNSTFESETLPVMLTSEDFGLCNEDCAKSQRVCVMGSDFKPHCEVAVDACQQMRCVKGNCVSKNGLHMCECNQGWLGPFCDKPCGLDCGKNGNCGHIDHNGTVGCICHWNYTGHRCQEKRKIVSPIIEVKVHGKELKAWETATAVVVTVVVLVLLCILLPYLLWRRQWMPIRKLVFYFQEFEDDDDKEYDAFISYKSAPSDERFILKHLYPKLEKELHFKLCLHFRDFPPGEPIANNIIRAIEGSRRTILILSPSFISSEWCRMEYQKAQYEMLRLKHKIIPIIVEDISNVPEIDKNLKTIIDTVTYITWPGDEESPSSKRLAKFWKLLELSMPKRRPEYHRGISSTESCFSDVLLTALSDTSISSGGVSPISVDDDFFYGSSFRNESSNPKSSNCFTTEGSTYPFIAHPSLSNGLRLQLETVCTIPLASKRRTRQEININGNSESDNEEQPSGKFNSTTCVTERAVNNQNILLNERERQNVPISVSVKYTDPQLMNVFQTSDDHIVEIREVGPKGLTIKPKPRQILQQLFV